jgi:hypothetical protein
MTPPDFDVSTLEANPQVRRWFESARFDDDPAEERQRKLALLGEFCDHTGQSPEELVKGLLRTTKAGDTAISSKRRETMNTTIDEFVEKLGLTGKDAIVTGNTIRGFLVHNGIFIQGRAWRGTAAPTSDQPR